MDDYPIIKISIYHNEEAGRLEMTVDQLVSREHRMNKQPAGATYQRIEDRYPIPLDVPIRLGETPSR